VTDGKWSGPTRAQSPQAGTSTNTETAADALLVYRIGLALAARRGAGTPNQDDFWCAAQMLNQQKPAQRYRRARSHNVFDVEALVG
jgi:hypothetical protein